MPVHSFSDDHFVLRTGATWEDYRKADEELTGNGYRIKYCDGLLQIMTISHRHELIKSNIGSLLEAYCVWNEIR